MRRRHPPRRRAPSTRCRAISSACARWSEPRAQAPSPQAIPAARQAVRASRPLTDWQRSQRGVGITLEHYPWNVRQRERHCGAPVRAVEELQKRLPASEDVVAACFVAHLLAAAGSAGFNRIPIRSTPGARQHCRSSNSGRSTCRAVRSKKNRALQASTYLPPVWINATDARLPPRLTRFKPSCVSSRACLLLVCPAGGLTLPRVLKAARRLRQRHTEATLAYIQRQPVHEAKRP